MINDKWYRAINSKYNDYVEKSMNFRISEGVRVYECSSIRRKLSLTKGVELAEERHEFDQKLEERLTVGHELQGSLPSKELEVDTDSLDQKDKTEPMVFTTRTIPTEEW